MPESLPELTQNALQQVIYSRITFIWHSGYEMSTSTLINTQTKQLSSRVAFQHPYTSVKLYGPCSHVPRHKYEMGIEGKVPWPMRGFRLPPRRIGNLRPFGNLRCVECQFLTDVSGPVPKRR